MWKLTWPSVVRPVTFEIQMCRVPNRNVDVLQKNVKESWEEDWGRKQNWKCAIWTWLSSLGCLFWRSEGFCHFYFGYTECYMTSFILFVVMFIGLLQFDWNRLVTQPSTNQDICCLTSLTKQGSDWMPIPWSCYCYSVKQLSIKKFWQVLLYLSAY